MNCAERACFLAAPISASDTAIGACYPERSKIMPTLNQNHACELDALVGSDPSEAQLKRSTMEKTLKHTNRIH